MAQRTAIVAGPFGAVGHSLVAHLEKAGDWQVIGLGRRRAAPGPQSRFIAVDLTDAAAARAALSDLPPADTVFFAAYAPRPTPAEEVVPNLAMLQAVMEAVEPRSPALNRVVLLQGSKWYGNHLGPYKTPANEDDPRLLAPHFYYAQQDWLAERQWGKSWTWSALRPHAVIGFAENSAMTLLNVLAVYAAVSKELGQPLRFPGKPGAYDAVYQMTDAGLLARAMVWAASEPACANQPFNITNGDLVRWCHLWPKIAAAFDMEVGPPQPLNLEAAMADKEPLWASMVARHGLRPSTLAQLASWRFGDFVFASNYDHISNLTRARQAGWCESLDTEAALIGQLRALRRERVVP
jgi:nucleoside-diphosphate-sugar epimerase